MSREHVIASGIVALYLAGGTASAGVTVETGWDIFSTRSATFQGAPFEGVPLGMFDFGVPFGTKNTFDTDTVVERKQPALPGLDAVPGGSIHFDIPPAPGIGVIPIEIVALQLRSVVPIDPDGPGPAPFGTYFVTLDGSNPSIGEMEINFALGTFSSVLNVDFDLRFGSLDGPVIFSDFLPLASTDTPWDRTPPPNALQIDGINRFLNGFDRSGDFWPGYFDPINGVDFFQEIHPVGLASEHTPQSATPAPGAAGLLILAGFTAARRRRSSRSDADNRRNRGREQTTGG